ncbi:MAG: carotenoid oxygenase family protein [Microthrixaceae bacterium]
MAQLTGNLFHGAGEGSWKLEVFEGHWPADAYGDVFVVGPDKRRPGGHWFGESGILHRFSMEADPDGRVDAVARRLRTPVIRMAERFPALFRTFEFAQVSPLGVTNMANTNVQSIDGRLFVGYDAGRPIEVDPVDMEVLTPVGSNGEWAQMAPGLIEPMCPVAAHPAPAWEERALYFVNYFPMPAATTHLARWPLSGPVERWPLRGMGPYDSIHDIKATRNHLVFCDLPFRIEPEALLGRGPRRIPNQDVTQIWIVAKDQLRCTPPGQPVDVTEVQVPVPSGHLLVDVDDDDGVIRVHTEHIALADLMITFAAGEATRSGDTVSSDHEGLVSLGQQPGCMGTYEIVAATGEVRRADRIFDERFWGGVLSTHDQSDPEAREHVTQAWYAGSGYDPDMVSQRWWDLYEHAGNTALVPMADLPVDARPGGLARFDLQSAKVADVFSYDGGAFPSPPTFVPRRDRSGPGDGYVVVLVHCDRVPGAHSRAAARSCRSSMPRTSPADPWRAAASGFNPPLLLHSHWMDRRTGPRPSDYRVPPGRDLAGALAGFPARGAHLCPHRPRAPSDAQGGNAARPGSGSGGPLTRGRTRQAMRVSLGPGRAVASRG